MTTGQSKPKISVVIPAYNEEKYIGRTLEALLNQDFPREDYEVIVVDNGSKDETSSVAKKYGVRVLSYTKTQGVSGARQYGSFEANGEIIAGTDSDTAVSNNWLSTIWQDLGKTDYAGVSGSVGVDGSFGDRLSYELGFGIHRLVGILTGSVFFTGGNFAIKRDVFEKIGGFRSELMSGEDLDLSLRAAKVGKILFDRRLKVKTLPRRLKEGALKSFWRYTVMFFGIKYNFTVPGFTNYR